ncbi:YafY family protein [Geothrix sp. PMB-07]|uniref:helix-turn-helix transcriptional regulator n=1 Tax=Geothrix sp. PMB-07 TaxID=3068640 RepID=UPI0027420B12|nr:WYL domain-containing protein [Geothrix sp. PMB-07]WLT33214.1 WYL domain-containing protein [Geothrix sp. PMB-07]
MAVTKTPRKKPVTAATAEDKPAAKAKTASAKKAVAKAVEPAVVDSVAAEAAVAKSKDATKAPAKGKAAKAVEATPVSLSSETPESMPVEQKRAATTAAATVPATLPPLAQAVLSAICEGRAVEFIFADAETNAPRTFEPRHLTFDALSKAWYVWGWDRRYNAERHHRVDLLAEVNAVDGAGRAAQGPYAEGTPANLIGGWLGGDPIQVKATLLKQWVFAVKQAPPAFPNFKIEEQGDGQALVSFTATDLRAIARWAMQFGDGIQVLEPARLVDRIKQVGAVWAGRERQGIPAAAPAAKPAPRPEPPPEPRRHESRPPREHRSDRGPEREHRPEREEAPKAKPGKIEVIRFDRL